jgi:hypothetical protein
MEYILLAAQSITRDSVSSEDQFVAKPDGIAWEH